MVFIFGDQTQQQNAGIVRIIASVDLVTKLQNFFHSQLQLRLKFILLINIKMPTIVGIFKKKMPTIVGILNIY